MTLLRHIYNYYAPHVAKYKVSILATLGLYGAGAVLVNVAQPLIYKRIIDIITNVSMTEASGPLIGGLVLLGVTILVYNIFFRVGDFTMVYSQSKVLMHLSNDAFARLSKHSYAFFSGTFIGSLVAKSKRYVDSFETLHDTFVFHVWMNGISLVGALVTLLWFAPALTGIYVAWLAAYVLVTIWFIRRGIPRHLSHAESQSKTTGALADALTNVLTIKMFAGLRAEKGVFGSVTAEQEHKRANAWNWNNWEKLFQGFAVAFVEIAVMSVAVMLWLKGSISAGTIVLAQIYLFTLFNITWNLGRNITRVVQAVTDAKEAIDIFETPIDVKDVSKPETVHITDGAIEFDDVTFSYNEGVNVFDKLNLRIPAGQKVGLVGHSGAGKTTITKLLLRFANVTGGAITIDRQNIARITQDDLRRNIAYVPQEPILFHRSLRENIAYGNPGATDAEVEKAAERAHAHNFIGRLPEGYGTLVGERGVKLSGGERQRVAIARAMLKDAPVLILDEATSSLDSLSERHIQAAFAELMKGKTTLVVAHRLSTVQAMDRILVFDKGAIIEDGTHDELVALKGTYYELWKEQSSGFIGE